MCISQQGIDPDPPLAQETLLKRRWQGRKTWKIGRRAIKCRLPIVHRHANHDSQTVDACTESEKQWVLSFKIEI